MKTQRWCLLCIFATAIAVVVGSTNTNCYAQDASDVPDSTLPQIPDEPIPKGAVEKPAPPLPDESAGRADQPDLVDPTTPGEQSPSAPAEPPSPPPSSEKPPSLVDLVPPIGERGPADPGESTDVEPNDVGGSQRPPRRPPREDLNLNPPSPSVINPDGTVTRTNPDGTPIAPSPFEKKSTDPRPGELTKEQRQKHVVDSPRGNEVPLKWALITVGAVLVVTVLGFLLKRGGG